MSSPCASPTLLRKSTSQTSVGSTTSEGKRLIRPSADFCNALLFLFAVVESGTGKPVSLGVDDFLLASYKLHKRLRQIQSPFDERITYTVPRRFVRFATLLFQETRASLNGVRLATSDPKSLFPTIADTFVRFLNTVVLAAILYTVCTDAPASEAYTIIRWYMNHAFPLLFTFPPSTENAFQQAIFMFYSYLHRTTYEIEDSSRRGYVCLQRCLPQLNSKKYQVWCETFRKAIHRWQFNQQITEAIQISDAIISVSASSSE